MFIAVLGRQPEISIAELEAVFGAPSVTRVADDIASVEADEFDLSIFGGTTKAGRVVGSVDLANGNDTAKLVAASKSIVHDYRLKWRTADHKITLGISTYGLRVTPRDVQKTGLLLKSALKKDGVSLRLVPNTEPTLSTATSHNNKLGLSPAKVELMIIRTSREIIIAESIGAQNITAYTRRDHGKPKRDAFVGMLPPKLAQIMLNLALTDPTEDSQAVILDPFCGTGTVLQEALLRDLSALGSDLSEKMVDYTEKNLDWLITTHKTKGKIAGISAADATKHRWPNAKNITAVVCETYLGQPFSAPPSPAKLKEVVGNCNHIISQFLANIRPQLQPGTPLCIAVPSWRSKDGSLTHLPLIRKLADIGFELQRQPLIYSRPDQVVAREILVLKTSA